jgi:aminoglycoside 6'-N-acetyltransferase
VDVTIRTPRALLRPLTPADGDALRSIRESPAVARWWHPTDAAWPVSDPDVGDPAETRWAVDVDGVVKGLIQVYEWPGEDYRNASIDVFLDASVHGMGLGREVVGAVMAHSVDALGHHRITIDPAADNAKAIACYSACGFRPVGVMRHYERDTDGPGWHDGLFMEWVAGIDPRSW